MLSSLADIQQLEKIHQLALDNQIAFASYCLPGASQITTLVQWKSEPAILSDLSDLESQSGFVFAPFDLQSATPIRLIQPDLIIQGDTFSETFLHGDKPWNQKPKGARSSKALHQASRDEYTQQVEALQQDIAAGPLDKVVLSRISLESKPEGFNPSAFFMALQQSYPDAFVFMLYISDTGLWFGATPEPLLQVQGNTVSTVSLAGTRSYHPEQTLHPWGEKEIDEQEIVTRYIDELLNRFGIQSYHREGPLTQRAGSVEHLLTRFGFKADQLQQPVSSFLKALHPTPSVCGLPKELAFAKIRQTEKHLREYYTGFLGPVNMYNQWHLFVNLRSMKVEKDQLAYFLGAGITAGSDPVAEWEETNKKKKTLLQIIEALNL